MEADSDNFQAIATESEMHSRLAESQSGRSSLQSKAYPTSTLPLEVLGMIFEAGLAIKRPSRRRFEIVVSHVCRRWRSVAIRTPTLWTEIRHYSSPESNRTMVYLARSGALPITLLIRGLRQSTIEKDFVEVVDGCISRCRQLSLEGYQGESISTLLKQISCHSAPLLTSIEVACKDVVDACGELFSSTAPSLTSVRLGRPGCSYEGSMNPLLHDAVTYAALRDILMNMTSLTHLELQMTHSSLQLLITLPSLEYLSLDTRHSREPHNALTVMQSFQAPKLREISLRGISTIFGSPTPPSTGPPFPSLRKLYLEELSGNEIIPLCASFFPEIVEFTWHSRHQSGLVHEILRAVRRSITGNVWHNLKAISVLQSDHFALNVPLLRTVLAPLKAESSVAQIRIAQYLITSTEAIDDLKEIMDIESYADDRPNPFLT